MNGALFNNLSKCSSAFALSLIILSLVQFCHCYGDTNRYQNQHQSRDNSDYYNDNTYSSSLKNISSRDISALAPSPASHLPSKGFVAYHRSLHNTSWAITIPLFSFLLPTANSGDPVNIGNQAIYGFFAAVITIISFAIPILFNGKDVVGRSLEDSNKITLSHLMHPAHLMNLMGLNIGNQIGIDPIKCLQKTVCEAYRSPQNERYGMLALPFQYFFPAHNVSDSETTARSIYELAARDGKFSRTDCKKKYECVFDALDLATYCLSVYKRARKRAKAEEQDVEGKNPYYNLKYSKDTLNDFSRDKIMFR